ncbi:protein DBF4 homolog B [Candoia aspera]|uniref:protein DBF4 homolog B n=1 Tax=Candoia aspera TaxID=51853 RepID=UPI002FD7E9F7
MTDGKLCDCQSFAPLDGHGQNSHVNWSRKDDEAVSTAKSRPLSGKSFFLDLPSGKNLAFLAENVKRLGGVIESFLSKEVTCVISSSRKARQERRPEKQSATVLKDALAGTQSVSRLPEGQRGPLHKPVDVTLVSRGKRLLHKAIGSQDNINGSNILVSARSWGIQIMHIDEMLSYIRRLSKKQPLQRKGKVLASGFQLSKVRLKPPFMKIEDHSRQLRPFLKLFKNFPRLYFLASRRCSPFEPSSKDPQIRKSPNEPQTLSVRSVLPKTQKGYCECCEEAFTELQMHLQSSQHQEFVLDPSHYAFLDSIISQLSNDFVASCTPLLSICNGVSSEFEMEAAEHAEIPFSGQEVEGHVLFEDSTGHLASLEDPPCLLKDQDFLHLTVKSKEMPTAPVPFALRSLWSASETHEKGRVIADTFPKIVAPVKLKFGVAPQEGKLPTHSGVLPCKRKHPYGQYGQVKKRQTLTSNKRLSDKNLLSASQQVGTTGHSFPSQLDLPAVPSYTPSSYCVPPQLPQKVLHCQSCKPVAIDTSYLKNPVQQLDQKEVSAISPCKEWDMHGSCNFSSNDSTLSSLSGFHEDKKVAPKQVGSLLECRSPCLDISELAQNMLPQQPGPGPSPCLPLFSYPLTSLSAEAKSSSSMSEWDGPLLCALAGASHLSSENLIDAALLGTCVSLQDSNYESHLCSVLWQTSEQGQLK